MTHAVLPLQGLALDAFTGPRPNFGIAGGGNLVIAASSSGLPFSTSYTFMTRPLTGAPSIREVPAEPARATTAL